MPSVARLRLLVLSLVVAAALAGACQALPGLPAPALDNTGWRAVEVGGLPPVAGREPTLSFQAGRIGGSTGCNGFGGDIAIDGMSIKLGEVAMTLIGCDDEIGDVEGRFMQILGSVDRATLRADGMLVLSGPAGNLVFRSDPTVRG